MDVHLIDGTYELFRYYHALPPAQLDGVEIGAVRGVVGSVLGMMNRGATHVGGRDRSRHRVVPERTLARLQDQPGRPSRTSWRSFPSSRRR